VASTPTAWRALDSIPEPLLERLQAARARARASVWAFGMAPKRVTLDFDSTLVEVESENKEQAAPNWKHGFGFHPLLVYLDQTGEALAGQLRPGNAGANTAQDHVELLDAALQQLPWPTRAEDPELGPRVLVRSDSAGASHGFVGAIAERGLEFSVGFDVAEPVREAILQLPERSWVVAIAKELEERGSRGGRDHRAPRPLAVAPGVPCLGAPGGAPSRCQLQPLRSPRPAPPSFDHQLQRHRPRLPGGPPPPPCPGGRPDQGGQGVRPRKLPLRQLPGQPGVAFAGADGPGPAGLGRQLCLPAQFLEAAPKRLRYQLLHVAGRLVRSGRQSTLRLDARWPWAAELAAAFTSLRSLPLTT
jgi:hypothetical protein